MMTFTSASANKMLRKLKEDKNFWHTKEYTNCSYVAANNEEPVIPEYDYVEVSRQIAEIDDKVAKIKHAINVSNATNRITFCGREMTIDEVLVRMAQLNSRKEFLDNLRKRDPKRRVATTYASRNAVPEYEYINYDLELVKMEYEEIDSTITAMQIALDTFNQTVTFEVDI